MSLNIKNISFAKKQQGNLLIITLVISVTLLALGLALSKVLSGAAQQNTIEYYGARAYMAAQSGLETGLSEIFALNSTAQTCSAVTTSRSFSTLYLANCEVELSCSEYIALPDSSTRSGTVNIYYLQSSATCAANDCAAGAACQKEYWQTQRTLSVEAKTLP
ncbi:MULTISPECIES: agglutinin biogenesis protein MshP [unclassified Pseudoalteromonas]|uniref:agglutinin biogenesis protein MshP n=1 Tax=unclassified Pseudoalteromonas TaxID=194690 RepID=UPI00257DBA6D|nr:MULTISPECIES: agglutinin biogenesis protein MshP [unclassified Pseudoalteromonas]|tara:strand:+ start:1556 stop:2041 length:486 start_codon:yes stop_codon:yes gene_type:complete